MVYIHQVKSLGGSMYKLYDEDGEYMRWVKRREEAQAILATHQGWKVKYIKTTRKVVDLSQFEEAPF